MPDVKKKERKKTKEWDLVRLVFQSAAVSSSMFLSENVLSAER